MKLIASNELKIGDRVKIVLTRDPEDKVFHSVGEFRRITNGRIVIRKADRRLYGYDSNFYSATLDVRKANRIKKTGTSDKFKELNLISSYYKERGDCTVISIAATTGRSYEDTHVALKAAGRVDGQGARLSVMRKAIDALGFTVTEMPKEMFINRYPKSHRRLKSVTSHHPERFNKVWKDGCNYIFINCKHALAVVDGENCDWSKGKALRVQRIWKIEAK